MLATHRSDTSTERYRFQKSGYILASNGLKWPRNAQQAAHQPEFGHFSPSGNNCLQYLPGFLKRWLLKIWPFWPERHRSRVFWPPMSLETTRERKDKGGERGEKKKGLLALIIFILPTLEIVSERQKSARDTPLGHLNRAVPFSKIRVYIGIKWAKMAKKLNAQQAAHQPEFGHFSPSGNNCLQYLPGFLKRWLLKIWPFWPERHRSRVFWPPMSLETTRERKEKGGERGEKKKGLLALIIFILPTLKIVSERQKSARDTPLGHLNRAVPFSKIRVYIGIKWAKMAKKLNAQQAAHQPEFGHFSPSGNNCLQYLPGFLKRWLLKIWPFWPERHRSRVFWPPMSLETTRERKEKGGERGEKKKGLLALIIFILPTLKIVSERQKSARDTPLGHLNRAVPFSKIRVYIGIKWAKMAKKLNAQQAAHQPEFGHFSPSGNNCLQYLPGFLKRWLLKIWPFWPERHRSRVFWPPMSLETTRERKEKGGERGEKKKGLLALIIFILPTLKIVSERQKSARDTPLGHLNRAVPFSKIRVYIGIKWAKMAKKLNAQQAAHQPEFGHFSPSGNNCLQYLPGFLKRWLLKIWPFWPERQRSRVFWPPMSLETTRERKEKGGERGEKKKGLLALIIFILPTLKIVSERQKSARDTPLGHLNRAVPFSKIRVYIGIKWAKMAKKLNAQQAAHQPEFGHFSPSGNNCLQYLPGFLKRWLLKIWPFWPERQRSRVFWPPMSLETTRERKEKGGERGEKKKGLLALIIFILPTLKIVSERQKSARDTPLGHLNRAVPFSKIRVYIGIKWAKMAKKCSTGRSSARIRSFFAIWQQLLAISTWIFEKVAPEDLAILAGTTPKPGFLASHEPRNHTGEKREGRGERGEEKRTAGTHNFYIAYFGDSF